ncbi:5'-3' exoribonuclease 1 isoform X1 [Drosophila bipectinata]|uniref:5'-3' exoribonuclease 1 isoform X1 n=1 Tax=Drosophila bipectinata TaxID=42026 RepID=UPI001C8A957F|nr:5'-3' exoribonuclease 1 isoform X1 [Drosophila bipectinata]XP_017089099.2 5'-3' exoribonuclease 1 isoform X1 [Drosophila bipectinata]
MGVPKFFRYISERYPCLSELAREHSIPEFDNLYLDMNGIVHNCSHPDDNNIHFHLEEAQIFQDIFNYVDKLFYLIKPQRLFFLAVDGVAPRAKMNQQRSRRFRSSREAEQMESKALQRGERREHERFDSNCITPGTEFMQRLQVRLRAFLQTKISTDPLWQRCTVILSGQETPGEGEHKIMDYIRFMKAQPGFDPNTRHCLYGLDADLIILGLCTHELHFVVLREEVKFGRNVKRTSVEETRFFLLHLGLLREYLELEFDDLNTDTHKLDVAQLIDDWVLMGFMVGNDFIPHLPCLHISSNALPLLYSTYIKIYPKLGGNINENGKLNLHRLQVFLTALSEVELDQFREHADDLKYMNAKTEAFDVDVSEITGTESYDSDLAALIDNSMKLYEGDSDEDLNDEEASLMYEFKNYKRNYYCTKFNSNSPEQLIEELSFHYVTALQWILDYYYRGVQSWDWYYPFHYAPFISDIRNVDKVKVNFQLGEPFFPFQQLLAVLPSASYKLMPTAYHDLMLNPNSPLAEFFPVDFESDLNGKKHDWEAVVLIPFIDEQRLLNAMKPCEPRLSEAEKERNRHGPMYQYDYIAISQGPLAPLPPLRGLTHLYCTEVSRWAREIALNLPHSVCVELPNAARHVFYPGFPTMQHLPFEFEIRNDRVKVFEQVSRNQNMVLKPLKGPLADTLDAVAGKFLEQVVHIGWPHLTKAKVVRVATRDQKVDNEGITVNDARRFESECKSLQEHFTTRMGIQFSSYEVLVYVRTYAGSSVEFGPKGEIFMRDAWSSSVTGYPAHGVVADLIVKENMRQQFRNMEELFPVGCPIFFIGNPYYGSEGTVLDPMLVYNCGRIQVNIRVRPEPDLMAARLMQEERDRDFMNSFEICRQLNINTRALGRLTGSMWVVLGPRREKMENVAKHNIGLQLKYPRQNEERAGYCCRSGNQWFYSNLALEVMREYCDRFPDVVDFFGSSNERSEFVFEQDIYPDTVGQGNIEVLASWVRQQPHMKVERVGCGSKTVCRETVELLLTAVDDLRSLPIKDVKLQVKPHLLIKPNVTLPDVYRSRRPVRLFDRVIVVRTIYMVPVGIKGTVIGVHPISDPNPVRLECVRTVDTFCDVLFDKAVPNFNDIHGIAVDRVYKVPESALVVIYTNDQGQKHQASEQTSLQGRAQAENVRIEKRDQQSASCSRYATAAGTDFNPITMKTKVAEEFLRPQGDSKAKSKSNKSQTETAKQEGTWRQLSQDQSAKQHIEGTEQHSNWRQRVNNQQNKSQGKQKSSSWRQNQRQQGGSSGGAGKGHTEVAVVEPTTNTTPQAQTLALMSILGVKQSSDTLLSQPHHPAPLPQAPLPQALPKAPLPGDMPNLPKPPLFWQQEAQKQQSQEVERIQSQKWYRRCQPIDQDSAQLVNGIIQPLQSQPLRMPIQSPSGLPMGFNNGNQLQCNKFVAPSVFNNNMRQPHGQHPRNYQQYSHCQQPLQNFTQLHEISNVAPRYTSIQDFVPIQAYRPKQSSRSQSSKRPEAESQPKVGVDKVEIGAGSSHQDTSRNENTAADLMQTLNIPQSSTSQLNTSAVPSAATDEGAVLTPNQAIKPRKQKVPRIGAKFDLEYIMH